MAKLDEIVAGLNLRAIADVEEAVAAGMQSSKTGRSIAWNGSWDGRSHGRQETQLEGLFGQRLEATAAPVDEGAATSGDLRNSYVQYAGQDGHDDVHSLPIGGIKPGTPFMISPERQPLWKNISQIRAELAEAHRKGEIGFRTYYDATELATDALILERMVDEYFGATHVDGYAEKGYNLFRNLAKKAGILKKPLEYLAEAWRFAAMPITRPGTLAAAYNAGDSDAFAFTYVTKNISGIRKSLDRIGIYHTLPMLMSMWRRELGAEGLKHMQDLLVHHELLHHSKLYADFGQAQYPGPEEVQLRIDQFDYLSKMAESNDHETARRFRGMMNAWLALELGHNGVGYFSGVAARRLHARRAENPSGWGDEMYTNRWARIDDAAIHSTPGAGSAHIADSGYRGQIVHEVNVGEDGLPRVTVYRRQGQVHYMEAEGPQQHQPAEHQGMPYRGKRHGAVPHQSGYSTSARARSARHQPSQHQPGSDKESSNEPAPGHNARK